MTLTKKTFELLATLDKYNVEFRNTAYDFQQHVRVTLTNTSLGGVYYWFTITSGYIVNFEQRYSVNTGKCSKGWNCGYNFEKRMIRDLQKANLI